MPAALQHHPKGAPGSPRALALGCTCDPEDNRHGAGNDIDPADGLGIYHVHRGCPVHANRTTCMPIWFD